MSRAIPSILAFLLHSTIARADSVQVDLHPQGLVGKSFPALEIHILEPIAGFELNLKRSDGQSIQMRGGGTPGATRWIDLRQPEGQLHYEGELSVNLPDAERSTLPLSFDAELLGPLRLTLDKKDVDVPGRQLSFRLSRPAKKAQFKVVMDTGAVAFDGEVPFQRQPTGTLLSLTWPQLPGRVFQITLRAYDSKDFFTEVEISPWQLEIPHEEVNFDTGRFEVRADQRPRLDDSFKVLQEALSRYGHLASLKLYIAGHTDSVGDGGSNRTLSLNRAKAIGAYFRKKGLQLPVFYEGFGEQALLVGTGDEVDEPKNRRAEYILSVDKPTVKNSPFEPNWRKL